MIFYWPVNTNKIEIRHEIHHITIRTPILNNKPSIINSKQIEKQSKGREHLPGSKPVKPY